jgi:hypothetical protein
MQTAQKAAFMEPTSTTAGAAGFAAVKLAAAFGVFAALAAILGLLLLPPRTAREFALRVTTTVVCSCVFGPLLAILVATWLPGVTESARWFAAHSGIEYPALAMLYILGPSMLIAGLPAWWILGGYMRWTARLESEDAVSWTAEWLRVFRGEK